MADLATNPLDPFNVPGNHSQLGYWDPETGNIFNDWLMHQDTFAHNESINAFLRESTFNAQQAEKARQFEKMMSDTQMQRKVADYLNAGFSPLAALEGAGSYQVSSAPAAAAHANPARNSSNNLGALFGSLLMLVANVMTHGAAASATNSGNAAKAALDAQKLDLLKDKVELQKGWLDLAKTGSNSGAAVAARSAMKSASSGFTSKLKNSLSNDEWNKLLDELDKL